jgi:hypothetical protein
MSIMSVALYFVFASGAATWVLMLAFVAVILSIGAVVNGFLWVGKLFGGKRSESARSQTIASVDPRTSDRGADDDVVTQRGRDGPLARQASESRMRSARVTGRGSSSARARAVR